MRVGRLRLAQAKDAVTTNIPRVKGTASALGSPERSNRANPTGVPAVNEQDQDPDCGFVPKMSVFEV